MADKINIVDIAKRELEVVEKGNLSGLCGDIQIIDLADLYSIPDPDSDFKVCVDDIVLWQNTTAKTWYHTKETGEVKDETVGSKGGESCRNFLEFEIPTNKKQLLGMVRASLNRKVIAIGKDRMGQWRIIGSLERPARVKPFATTGKQEDGSRYARFEIEAYAPHPAYIWTGSFQFQVPKPDVFWIQDSFTCQLVPVQPANYCNTAVSSGGQGIQQYRYTPPGNGPFIVLFNPFSVIDQLSIRVNGVLRAMTSENEGKNYGDPNVGDFDPNFGIGQNGQNIDSVPWNGDERFLNSAAIINDPNSNKYFVGKAKGTARFPTNQAQLEADTGVSVNIQYGKIAVWVDDVAAGSDVEVTIMGPPGTAWNFEIYCDPSAFQTPTSNLNTGLAQYNKLAVEIRGQPISGSPFVIPDNVTAADIVAIVGSGITLQEAQDLVDNRLVARPDLCPVPATNEGILLETGNYLLQELDANTLEEKSQKT